MLSPLSVDVTCQ